MAGLCLFCLRLHQHQIRAELPTTFPIHFTIARTRLTDLRLDSRPSTLAAAGPWSLKKASHPSFESYDAERPKEVCVWVRSNR